MPSLKAQSTYSKPYKKVCIIEGFFCTPVRLYLWFLVPGIALTTFAHFRKVPIANLPFPFSATRNIMATVTKAQHAIKGYAGALEKWNGISQEMFARARKVSD